MLTLFWSISHPSKVYAHRSSGSHALSVSRDLGWADPATLKIVQFHQYHASTVQEAEIFDDYDILRHGGGDGGVPPGEEDIYGPGPQVESIHSDDDPADVPVPDADSDSDLEDESFCTKWFDEIRTD